MCWEVTATYPPDRRSPSRARRFCTEQLAGLLPDGPDRAAVLDDTNLITTELITNALNAGSTLITLSLEVHRGSLRLRVDDDAPGMPHVHLSTPDEVHGRGLAITAEVAECWGVEWTPPTKTVWAELSVAADLTSLLTCER